jgi:hypothetical protein
VNGHVVSRRDFLKAAASRWRAQRYQTMYSAEA